MANQDPVRRSRWLLSPEQKWEIWLEVTTGELTQADAARKWGVDAGTVIRLRRDAKDACMSAFASSKPGRPSKARDDELERLRAENARTHRGGQGAGGRADPGAGNIALGLSARPVPARLPGEARGPAQAGGRGRGRRLGPSPGMRGLGRRRRAR